MGADKNSQDTCLPTREGGLQGGRWGNWGAVPGGNGRHSGIAVSHAKTIGRPEGQERLADRAQHVAWLARAGRPDFPLVAVLRVASGATMRQACTAAGIDPDVPGISAAAF